MTIDPGQLGAAFLLGLAGAGHCLGMCGGIAGALALAGDGSKTMVVAYHAGRVTSYAALGALLGLGASAIDIAPATIALRYLAAALMIAMGLYIANWWRGLVRLEQLGARLWRPVQRKASPLLPARTPLQAMGLGLTWGLMPCGLIYSGLALAATTQHPGASGAMMLLFGLGTLPAMLTASLGARQLQGLLAQRSLKIAIALSLIAFGVWTAYITTAHSGHLLQRPEAHGPHAHH